MVRPCGIPGTGCQVPLAAIRNEWIVGVVKIPELQLLAPGGKEGIVHLEEVAMLFAAMRIEQVVILEQILDLVALAAIGHKGFVPVHQGVQIQRSAVLATSRRYEGIVLLAHVFWKKSVEL